MTTYSNPFAQQIFNILYPLIGETIAKGSLRSQCTKLGITENQINKEHLSKLADGVRKGLVIFIGTDEAQKVADKINHCHL